MGLGCEGGNNIKDTTTDRAVFSKGAECLRGADTETSWQPFVSGLGKFPLKKGKSLLGGVPCPH